MVNLVLLALLNQLLLNMGLFCINTALLAPKLAYFFFFFSYSSVTPYIAVFMSSNGLNPEQAGLILGARLFAQFVSGPVWGGIADKTRKYKLILLLQIIISSVLLFSAPWVPFMLPKDASTTSLGSNSSVTNPKQYTPGILTTAAVDFNGSKPATKPYHWPSAFTRMSVAREAEAPPATASNTSSWTGNQTANQTSPSSDRANKHNMVTLFQVMVTLFTFVGLFDGGILLLVDNSVINTLKDVPRSSFGKQRLWGAVGFGLASLASGVGIELSGSDSPNYFTMFYIFIGSNACLIAACTFLKMPARPNASPDHPAASSSNNQKPNQKPIGFNGLARALRKPSVLFFFATILMMGMADNLLYSFMFLYIQDLQGSKIVMGLSVLVSCCSEALTFPFTKTLIKRLHGNLPSISLSFAMYSLRYVGFSLVQNAWYILLLQLLHSVCFALFWAAAIYHTTGIAPNGMKATFLGIQNGMFFGIAGGTASIIGGVVYKRFGGRNLFRGYAGVCAFWTMLLLLHVVERKRKGKLTYQENEEGSDEMKECKRDEDQAEEPSPSMRLVSQEN